MEFFPLGSFHKEKYSKEGYLSIGRAKGSKRRCDEAWMALDGAGGSEERTAKQTDEDVHERRASNSFFRGQAHPRIWRYIPERFCALLGLCFWPVASKLNRQ